ncbi:MAG: (d)CMP kinase [Alphaproteobacteria bacterium]|jgi:cytidylate kinase|nr:(d)CMP kinase [Alphaproteobacteria bacterium]
MIIAVDGESASGKGTVSKLLAEKLKFAYLDTGLLYRAVAFLCLQKNVMDNEESIITVAQNITSSDLNIDGLRGDDIAVLASRVANIPKVREALFNFQVDFANNPPNGKKGAILDGRDIGSVICPNAEIKFYVCASAEERANRRYKELVKTNPNILFEDILNSLKKRDENDKNRAIGALKKVDDAILVDNTNLNIEETFNFMYSYIKKIMGL